MHVMYPRDEDTEVTIQPLGKWGPTYRGHGSMTISISSEGLPTLEVQTGNVLTRSEAPYWRRIVYRLVLAPYWRVAGRWS